MYHAIANRTTHTTFQTQGGPFLFDALMELLNKKGFGLIFTVHQLSAVYWRVITCNVMYICSSFSVKYEQQPSV